MTINTNKGFTLLELMVVIVMASILMAIAVPSFQSSVARNNVQSHQRDLKADLNYARSESVSRGATVAVCGSNNGTTCNSSSDWSNGWLVFVDDGAGAGTARDGIFGGDEEILRVSGVGRSNSVALEDAAGSAQTTIAFNQRGYLLFREAGSLSQPNNRLTVQICDADGNDSYARAVAVDLSGRVGETGDANNNAIFDDVAGSDLDC